MADHQRRRRAGAEATGLRLLPVALCASDAVREYFAAVDESLKKDEIRESKSRSERCPSCRASATWR